MMDLLELPVSQLSDEEYEQWERELAAIEVNAKRLVTTSDSQAERDAGGVLLAACADLREAAAADCGKIADALHQTAVDMEKAIEEGQDMREWAMGRLRNAWEKLSEQEDEDEDNHRSR